MSTILIVGATGATGRHLVRELLDRGHRVKAIVRSRARVPRDLQVRQGLTLIEGTALDFEDRELAGHVDGCDGIASCLGHTLSFKGIFGPPHRLVTNSVRRLCEAIRVTKPAQPIRFVLMNTTGNRNRDLAERVSLPERAALSLLRRLVPPHADNEDAAQYLRTQVGPDDPVIQWVAVRPDTLIDEDAVSAYELHPSPIRSPLFNAGKTSRINVGHFMATLLDDDAVWSHWKGRMPVMYNQST
ncbi:MAG: SDR family oxidoreductase [Candidatus Eisenbacteria bacterium]|uniref:SDR family oxidoreductase n=1 Tax=Eiseniibacteriota bacterium TaxID=2212470 RepID=A0A956LVI4_UNCEI|nr:SDR family oxidoreductase [Candidatus Eisenbacteria bacterium]